YVSSNFTGTYSKIEGYKKLSTNGWVTKTGFNSASPFLQMPTAVGGNAGVKHGDYYYQDANQENKIVMFGGYWAYGSTVGISIFNLNYSSTHSAYAVGSRLLKTAL
ncbi:MAG: hypothetical protein RSF67_06145, partial [Clostridia bacterium]